MEPTALTPEQLTQLPQLKKEIAAMVEALKKLEAVTPEILEKLDGYLTAYDEDVPRVHEILTGVQAETDQIESEANVEMKKLLDQYVIDVKAIEKEAKKLTLNFEESVDHKEDEKKEEDLLLQVSQL